MIVCLLLESSNSISIYILLYSNYNSQLFVDKKLFPRLTNTFELQTSNKLQLSC